MTIQETRQMGIEFERRVQTMIPQKEIRRLIATAKEENIKKLLKGAFDFVKMIINS